ncbi:right-handed parallel beta-helix repeat-containing protein [Methylomonas sp. WSC-7]|uniref:Right-handed parallel beta-helix repeat-containing protein n=2 Tax=Methylomonas rosea TaxID=2952227 RepID=A0ABT1TYX5_9GAMM|nr:right-handed parallel beta-helix repeat-containing protein [Methylomonas sp. WSC-7]MCQ8119730.1 right-handed parallel beta-helix repeat-containing protein [Methylomonas sp. WSC-7]
MHRLIFSGCLIGVFSVLLALPAHGTEWQVGPQRALKLPSAAARLAKDGDIVSIDAGLYQGDVASWPQQRLTIRGLESGAHLDALGKSAEDKAIWVLKGDDIVVENIELSGAAAPALNGAGIRFEGSNLTLKNCHFHHNQMGILTGFNANSAILIEYSEFNDNTVDYPRYGKLGHNIYIGNIRRFTLQNSYVHDASTGHNVKSRARENYILYNRVTDERNGSSYLVDLPDGGAGYLIGNLFHQGANTENAAMLAFAAEHNQTQPNQELYLVNNTFVNDHPGGSFLNNHSIATAMLINNLLIGEATELLGPYQENHDLKSTTNVLSDPASYDYRLKSDAPAIDQGIWPGIAANGFPLDPQFVYRHPCGSEKRRQQGALDVGAYEFIAKQPD